ncbi:MAG: YraN family protein [Chlorobiota bacterium]|jgi:putative endonuclease|nr:YraN family protein [Chlorobiota bacterium]QQS66987.1 MAG: YraN family protein [Chlorobiota bacterium]
MNTREIGLIQEEIALNFLLNKGYTLVKKNFRLGRIGEIDIVMKDKHIFVFIEVKSRFNNKYGGSELAVSIGKRKQVRKVAEGFVQIMNLENFEGRFDIVAIDYLDNISSKPSINHIVNAF